MGASSTFGSTAGRLLTLRSDDSYQPYSAYGHLDTQHVAGLHIVYATDNSITPFLMYTQATNGTTTVWPYGLSSSDPFAYWKAETGEGSNTPSEASQWDVYIRVAGNGAADVVNTSGVNWASSTALNGVTITIERWDGWSGTATTGDGTDPGWARFPGAHWKMDTFVNREFTITAVSYTGGGVVGERLKKLVGVKSGTDEQDNTGGFMQAGKAPQDYGYTTIKMFAEKRTVVPNDANGQRGSGTFTVIYSTVGLDGSSMVSSDDVFMRLAGTAETDVTTNGVTFDSSTELNGVTVTLRRGDGKYFTVVTGRNGMDNGWARFVEARKDKGNFNVSYEVAEINYVDTQVNARLQDLVGIVVNSHTNGAVDQGI